MMRSGVLLIAAAIGLLTGCAATATQEPVSALLVEPTAAVRTALQQAVTAALNGRDVSLAEDALTQSSRLLIEPDRPRDTRGRILQGRDTRSVESFRLLKQGDECLLVHEGSERQFVLAGADCKEEQVKE